MGTHRIVSVKTDKPRGAKHDMVVAICTQDDLSDEKESWTLKTVLQAMNRAERFYTQADNGRRARVQRYRCAPCQAEHIRTHISDQAIHEMRNLRLR